MDIETSNLSKCFEDAGRTVDVLSNISFWVRSGESVAVVGESGAGKTTFLYILGTLDQPSSGSVKIGGTEVTAANLDSAGRARFRGENIGFIFQFHQLLPEFTAEENVAMPLFIRGETEASALDRARSLLDRVGLSGRLSHKPGELSGGEQQRVAIARALAPNPGVLLADEPTGNLDQKTAASVQQLLFEVQREAKVTLVIVTHNREFAAETERVMELSVEGIKQV